MADLVTSESRRWLHGIQRTIVTDDDTGPALNVIPEDDQLTLTDEIEVQGELEVYGDLFIQSHAESPDWHNWLNGRSEPNVHPASSIGVTPVGGVTETDVQGAIANLDSRSGTHSYATLISILGFAPLSSCGYGYCYGTMYGGRM